MRLADPLSHRSTRRAFLAAAGAALADALWPAAAAAATPRPRRPRIVPPAYGYAARQAGVPPRLLYGVALQESAMLFGGHVLPWLWTLNVAGIPHRYATYPDGVRALAYWVGERGIRNVDCGPMQVNWRWHSDKLRTFAQALEANNNLAVGASILAAHYRETGDWFTAAGHYHHPSDQQRARDYAIGVFQRVSTLHEVPA